jgi:hypothetical protein
VLGVCVTYKKGFGFDDRIYWTLIKLITTFHKSQSSTGHSRLDFWPHYTDPLLHYCWSKVKVKVKVTLRLTASQSVSPGVEPHLGLMTGYLLHFDSYGLVFLGRPLTRGWVCLLYMQLALASVVFLGSESFETRDRILLSQIWDFPFRRLLQLAGSRWRYSNPPSHGYAGARVTHCYIASGRTPQKTRSLPLLLRILYALPSNKLFTKNLSPREGVYPAVA